MKYKTFKAYFEALGFNVSVFDEPADIAVEKIIEVAYPTSKQIYSYSVCIWAEFEKAVIDYDETVKVVNIEFENADGMSSREIRNLIYISRAIEHILVDSGVSLDEEYPFIDKLIADSEVEEDDE